MGGGEQNQKERDKSFVTFLDGEFCACMCACMCNCACTCAPAYVHACVCVLAPGPLMMNSNLQYPETRLVSFSLVESGYLVNRGTGHGDKLHLKAKLGVSLQ